MRSKYGFSRAGLPPRQGECGTLSHFQTTNTLLRPTCYCNGDVGVRVCVPCLPPVCSWRAANATTVPGQPTPSRTRVSTSPAGLGGFPDVNVDKRGRDFWRRAEKPPHGVKTTPSMLETRRASGLDRKGQETDVFTVDASAAGFSSLGLAQPDLALMMREDRHVKSCTRRSSIQRSAGRLANVASPPSPSPFLLFQYANPIILG